MVKRGPSTAGCKAASSRISIKHGLRAAGTVVSGVERLEDWKKHVGNVVASFEPESYVETELATRIAEIGGVFRAMRSSVSRTVSAYDLATR